MTSPRQTEHPDTGNGNHLDEALHFLRRLPVFKDTPLDMLKLYAYLSTRETYCAKEPILLQGDPCDRMYLIMSGEVSICKERSDRMFHLQRLTAEDFNYFGELALLARFNCFFSAWALTDVTLLAITRETFQKVLEKYPERYPLAVEKIVKLRVDRFNNQTDYLLDHLKEEAWRDCYFDLQRK